MAKKQAVKGMDAAHSENLRFSNAVRGLRKQVKAGDLGPKAANEIREGWINDPSSVPG